MRLIIAIAIGCLITFAGCASVFGDGAASSTADKVEPPDSSQQNTVQFSNLTSSQQDVFIDGLDGSVHFGPKSTNLDMYRNNIISWGPDLRAIKYVVYEEAYYRLDLETFRYLYVSRTVNIKSGKPDDGAEVVNFSHLSEEVQSEIKSSIPGTYESNFGERAPQIMQNDGYIRYSGETYVIEVKFVSEAPGYELSVHAYDGVATPEN